MKPDGEDRGGNGLDRRSFMSAASSAAMAGGLAAGYGAFAAMAGRFLYPARPQRAEWVCVAPVRSIRQADSIPFTTPAGAALNVTRLGDSGAASDFVALSSTCPHLGCKVHWQADRERYLCPCHNGTFDAAGKGTGGPPGDAGQSLPRYQLRVSRGLLFIQVVVERL